ncbi:MAG: CBS domain-containing protein [Candidatus Omnitrophica bacterium]|nr:CBS domain-containing protein [Candidatus Omnitrophota bacterium]
MKVAEAFKKDVIKVNRSLSLRKLLDLFRDFHTHPVIPVVDDNSNLIGVVYSEDLLDLLRPQQAKLFRNIPFTEVNEDVFDLEPIPYMGELIIVDDIMTTNYVAVKVDDQLEEAYKSMRLHKKERLPVVDSEGKLVGIIGLFDIIWQMFKEKGFV